MKRTNVITIVEISILVLVVIGMYGSLQLMELRAEEPRRAIVAMEMMFGKNYIVPKIFGYNYYSKPPLFNWLLVLMFNLTGSFNEIWVRLPSILSLFLTSFLVFKITAAGLNKKAGFIAAMLLLISSDLLFYGTVDAGEIDLFFMLLVFLQAAAVYYYSTGQNWWKLFIVSYICMAAGILTKGLPAIAIQALLLLSWFIYIKQFKKLFSIQHFAGMFIGFGIACLYFILYNKQADVFTYISQLLTESAQRTALENKWSDIALNLLQAPLQIFYICLPATALLLYACNKKVRAALRANRLFMFCFIFTLIICITFFISPGTANRYIYPAFPFIVIMAAVVYTTAGDVFVSAKWLISYKALLGVFAFFAFARIAYNIWGIPYQQKMATTHYRSLAAQILQHSGGQPVYLTGQSFVISIQRSLPFVKAQQQVVTGPPVIPYQLPYYISKTTGTVVRYDAQPLPGLFYLAPADFLKDKKATVYFTFFDDWTRKNIALVKF